MEKKMFLKTTMILIIGGFISKAMGMIIKIVLTRTITPQMLSLYMIIIPTYMLLITLSQLGFPIAISKLVAQNDRNNLKIVSSSTFISLILNLILMFLVIILAPFISNNLLMRQDVYYPIIACSLTLPFISLSSIIRGYFFGKQQMIPHVLSNVVEQIFRLSLILYILPKIMHLGSINIVCILILTSIIGEVLSIFIMLLFVPRNTKISRTDLIPDYENGKEILKISLPNTGSRIIGSIVFFLEPIILTAVLTNTGVTVLEIGNEYSVFTGFVLPLLLLPSFFTAAISQSLLPILTKKYKEKDITTMKRYLNKAMFFSLLIGIPVSILFTLLPDFFLNLVYNQNRGSIYLIITAPIFILHYIQSNLTTFMHAADLSKKTMKITLYSSILKLVSIITLCFTFGFIGLVIAYGIAVIFSTICEYKYVKSVN
ncbi:MAG: oligosaccharide flippase family protein [Bacilli bacterium]